MKKSSKKQVLFRIENPATSVIVRFGDENEKLYVVEVRVRGRIRECFEFCSSHEYECFIFRHYGFMIIPTKDFVSGYRNLYLG